MTFSNTIDTLLDDAGPGIRLRILTDILGESKSADRVKAIRKEVLCDSRVRYVLAWQQPDGYLGDVFHAGFPAMLKQKPGTRGAEGALRFLTEMGIDSESGPIGRALSALIRDDWFRDRLGVCWKYYPELDMYGLDTVRAATLVSAGIEDHDWILREQQRAVSTMAGVVEFQSMNDLVEDFRGRMVYKPGIVFPEHYHLWLLGRSQRWKTPQTVQVVAEAVRRLVHLSPFPVVKVRHKSRWLGPAAISPTDLRRGPAELGPDEWFAWFRTFELFARMGIVHMVPELDRQRAELRGILDESGGFFRRSVNPRKWFGWSAYSGLALESVWNEQRRVNDLTFRSLLILHLAELQPQQRQESRE